MKKLTPLDVRFLLVLGDIVVVIFCVIVVVPEGCLVVIVELVTVVEFVDTANTNDATVIGAIIFG